MPANLSAAAAMVWERVMRDQAPGVIVAAHADVLRLYCDAVVRYEDYSARLEKSGPILRGARGSELVRNPLVAMVRAAADQVRVTGRELGLTPSSLSGVHAFRTADQASEAMEELMISRRRII
jgi:P27 family predicted phage terminase small subunit